MGCYDVTTGNVVVELVAATVVETVTERALYVRFLNQKFLFGALRLNLSYR